MHVGEDIYRQFALTRRSVKPLPASHSTFPLRLPSTSPYKYALLLIRTEALHYTTVLTHSFNTFIMSDSTSTPPTTPVSATLPVSLVNTVEAFQVDRPTCLADEGVSSCRVEYVPWLFCFTNLHSSLTDPGRAV